VTFLLDGNVLAALALDSHEHHKRALNWWGQGQSFATCSVTQGTLLRVHMIMAEDQSAAAAWQALEKIEALPGHQFWDDGFSYTQVRHRLIQGPKQVTDAWLIELARKRNAKLATLDAALAALHKPTAYWPPI
jgi:uncharacterized protein